MKKLLLATTFAAAFTANATLSWTSANLNGIVPDNNLSGWTSSHVISGESGTIQAGTLQVTLNLSGGWNGDLYAYLVNSSGGFSVLLDRVGTGVSGVSPYGYGDGGMTVTLVGSGASIHLYGNNNTFSAAPSGTWMTDNTSGSLASFVNPNGTWSLFVADLSAGGVTTVQSWGLQMDIVAVPEIETCVAAALAGAFGAYWLSRQFLGGLKS